ncbi:ABC transporter ATP-binding protein [Brevibacillus sp. NRS-1366]|uniref:ABC transporter ATP-binding protein n=1 Tax=Brevibacillus sp. NRS-1366 TaxID=3233899 RepID=UPI003D1E4E81
MILQVKKLTAGYERTVIIRDIDLEVNHGSIMCLLGRNGVGKSTLLKTIMGVNPKMNGEIKFGEHDLEGYKSFQVAKSGVAYAPQEAAIFPKLTIEQNLLVGFPLKKQSLLEACEDAFRYFPILKQRLNQYAGTLSGGEQKMLLLARAMIRSPKLMLLDEITEGVQPSVIEKMNEALVFINKMQGTTVLLIEQNVHFALRIADSYAVMNQGRIIDKGIIDTETRSKVEEYLVI